MCVFEINWSIDFEMKSADKPSSLCNTKSAFYLEFVEDKYMGAA